MKDSCEATRTEKLTREKDNIQYITYNSQLKKIKDSCGATRAEKLTREKDNIQCITYNSQFKKKNEG